VKKWEEKLPTKIFVVTHGDKEHGTSDPGLTPIGRSRIELLEKWLKENGIQPTKIVCGTGRRHQQTGAALGFDPQTFAYDRIFGSGDSEENLDGELVVRLVNNLIVSRDNYGIVDLKPAIIKFLSQAINQTLIICGRPVISALGGDAQKSTFYIIVIGDDGKFQTIIKKFCPPASSQS